MSDYIKEALGRMSLHQLRSFLLYGTDDFAEDARPYRETLRAGSDPIYKKLENLYPGGIKLDEAAADLSQALTVYEHVYMELGLKAGARLLHQLLILDDPPLP